MFRIKICLLLTILIGLTAGIPCQAAPVETVSKAAVGAQTAGGDSFTFGYPMRSPVVSATGRYVAFISSAPNLVPGQSAGSESWIAIYLYDRDTGIVALVSHSASSSTTVCNGTSGGPGISADGRYVMYWGSCPDVVAGQAAVGTWVFLYDRDSGANVLVGEMDEGALNLQDNAPVISADGRYVVYPGAHPFHGLYLFDRVTSGRTLISHSASSASAPANDITRDPIINADGRYVAYLSDASNLVPGQTTGGESSIYLYDRVTNTNTLVTHTASSAVTPVAYGTEVMAMSADGRYVAYTNYSPVLVAGQVDTNQFADAFLYDRTTGTSKLLSHAHGSPTTAANASATYIDISADGEYVVFASYSSNLIAGQIDGVSTGDLFLHSRAAGTTVLVTHATGSSKAGGNGSSEYPRLSGDGRFLSFSSTATDLILGQNDGNGDLDVFRFDRISGTTALISGADGSGTTTGNGLSYDPFVSNDGGVFFTSRATDLDTEVLDGNGLDDVFLFNPGSLGQSSSGDFFTLPACRMLDTRQSAALVSGTIATFSPLGLCDVPEDAVALAINITVTGPPTGMGYLTLYPGGEAFPLASAISFPAGRTRSNNAIVPLASDGTATFAIAPGVTGAGSVHIILDVVGYFD